VKLDGFSRKRSGGGTSISGAYLAITGISSAASPIVSGVVANPGGTINGLTVHVFLDAVEVGTATTASDGTWTYTLGSPSLGSHAVTATVSVSTPASEFDFTELNYGPSLFNFSTLSNFLSI
jgi:hypothetical protein